MPATELDVRSLAYTTLKTLNDPKSADPEAFHDFSGYDFDDAFAPESFSAFFGDIISDADMEAALAHLNAERASEQETKYEQAEMADDVRTKDMTFFAPEKESYFAQEKQTYFAPEKETKSVETESDVQQKFQSAASELFTFRNGVRAAVVAFYIASALNVRVNPIALLALQIICIFCFFRLM